MASKDIYSKFFLVNILCYVFGLDNFYSKSDKTWFFFKNTVPLIHTIILNLFLSYSTIIDASRWYYMFSVPVVYVVLSIINYLTFLIVYSTSRKIANKTNRILRSLYDIDIQFNLVATDRNKWKITFIINFVLLFVLSEFCSTLISPSNKSRVTLRVYIYRIFEISVHYVHVSRFTFLLDETNLRLHAATDFFKELLSPNIFYDNESLDIIIDYFRSLDCLYKTLKESHTLALAGLAIGLLIQSFTCIYFAAKNYKISINVLQWLSGSSCHISVAFALIFYLLIIIEATESTRNKVNIESISRRVFSFLGGPKPKAPKSQFGSYAPIQCL